MDTELDALLAAMDRLPVEDVTGIPSVLTTPEAVFEEIEEKAKRKKSAPKGTKGTKGTPIAAAEPASPGLREWGDTDITDETLREMAVEIFGEERVDTTGAINSPHGGKLIILFPEIKIDNSRKQHHTIRGLLVRLHIYMRVGSACTISFEGLRTILTPEEENVSYAHSHLQHGPAQGQWGSFCQGSSRFKAVLTNCMTNPSEEQFYLALLSLERFLEWESLEGVPYNKISEIGRNTSRSSFNFDAELGAIISDLPDIFDYQEELLINLDHPDMKDFYENYSPIKSLNTGGDVQSIQAHWNRNYVMQGGSFKGIPLAMTIVPSGEERESHVSPEVVSAFNRTLADHITTFNNSFNYEYLRCTNTAIGAVPTFEQAKIDRYRASAKTHRLSSRSCRAQGVVGGVDNIRKREDNRLR